jgi:dienelactone hydrolase
MAEVVLFHHAQGLTPGVAALADALRAAGHTVHAPDLYDGRSYATLEEGMAHVKATGFGELVERAVRAVDGMRDELVYAGISLGVAPAQRLAQTRKGARGAILISACFPSSEFGSSWPAAVPLQVHAMEADPEFDNGGDLPAARAIVAEAEDAELFLYPGDAHLFVDASLPSYDGEATALLQRHVLALLRRI